MTSKNIALLTAEGTITKALINYIERKNIIFASFGAPVFSTDELTYDEAARLAQAIEFDLIPDNLTMNGQLAPDQIQLKMDECVESMNTLAELFADETQGAE